MISENLNMKVEEALRSFLTSSGNGTLVRIEITQVIRRLFSTVVFYRAFTGGQPYDAVLKKVVHHQMNIALTKKENQAEVEYTALSSLYPHFKVEDYLSVPEPIAVFPEEEAYLMEYIPGILLNEKLKSAKYISRSKDFVALKNCYNYCGRWLKKFQEVTAEHPVGVDIFSTTLRRCEEKLDMIQDVQDSRCPIDLKQRVLADLDRALGQIGNNKVLVAGRHGDFGGWNILTHENGVTVFDFLGSQLDSVAVDVLKMLVNFQDEKNYLVYNRRKVEELRNSFLEGYGALPKITYPEAVVCETLHRVCSLCASVAHTEGVGIVKKIEKNIFLQEHLRWLLSNQKKILWPELVKN